MKELEQIFTRTYNGEPGIAVVVMGTRQSIAQSTNYTECEFVFQNGELIHAGLVSDQPRVLRTREEENA